MTEQPYTVLYKWLVGCFQLWYVFCIMVTESLIIWRLCAVVKPQNWMMTYHFKSKIKNLTVLWYYTAVYWSSWRQQNNCTLYHTNSCWGYKFHSHRADSYAIFCFTLFWFPYWSLPFLGFVPPPPHICPQIHVCLSHPCHIVCACWHLFPTIAIMLHLASVHILYNSYQKLYNTATVCSPSHTYYLCN